MSGMAGITRTSIRARETNRKVSAAETATQVQSMLPYTVRGAVWLILYVFFILALLFALLAGTLPPTRDFWTEFSVAIGYSGLAMMGLQFGLTARFRHVTEPWGEDVIYHFHRQISLIAIGLVIAHQIILFVVRPELVALLNSIQAPWRARFAALSTYSLIALVVHMHMVSRSDGPRVRTVAEKAAIKVHTTTVCRNVPVWPKPGSGLAVARSRHIQPMTPRCPSSTRPRPRRSGPADQAKAQPMAWSA
jgi:hypothetical protein